MAEDDVVLNVAGQDTIAAMLTSAAHVHVLAMQLQGKTISISDAVRTVTQTWASLKSDERFLSAFRSPARAFSASDFNSRFELKMLLGEGAAGAVHLAHDKVLGHDVALKLFRDAGSGRSAQTLEFFKRKGAVLASIKHPGVARFYEAGTVGDVLYICMEYIPGMTLRAAIDRSGPLQPETFIPMFKNICAGVGVAHELGIVHRNLNPSNIMLEPSGAAKVLDFGVALSTMGDGDEASEPGVSAYLAPEQLAGRAPQSASVDVYALGLIALEALTGTRAGRENAPPATLGRAVPDRFSAAVARMLARSPAERFRNAGEIVDAIG